MDVCADAEPQAAHRRARSLTVTSIAIDDAVLQQTLDDATAAYAASQARNHPQLSAAAFLLYGPAEEIDDDAATASEKGPSSQHS